MIPDSEDPITAARGMLKGSGIFKVYLQEKEKEIARDKIQFARTEQHRTR
jgi:hypothetical protein